MQGLRDDLMGRETFVSDRIDSPPLSLPDTAQASEEIEREEARFRSGSAEEFAPKQ